MSRGTLTAIFVLLALMLVGCAYRLPPYAPPSTEGVRIIAAAPEQYILNVNMGDTTSLSVPHDGRVRVTLPAYRSCGVYLFSVIKIHGENDVFKDWNITVSRNGKIFRKVSWSKLKSLPTDQEAYHILKINN
jgi:hypothetical protein